MDQLDAADLLASMEADFQQAKQQVEHLQRTTVTEEIGHGLGKVVVNGYGRLRSITVDREAFHMTNERALAGKIVKAVNQAEVAAARLHEGDLR